MVSRLGHITVPTLAIIAFTRAIFTALIDRLTVQIVSTF
jgi:hypothetical protein